MRNRSDAKPQCSGKKAPLAVLALVASMAISGPLMAQDMGTGQGDGDTIGEPIDIGGGPEGSVPGDEGPVWAGGTPDFCEGCDGGVIDDGALPIDDDVVGDPVWTDPGIDSGGDGDTIGEPIDIGGGPEGSVPGDEGPVWAGGTPDFCEGCDGGVIDDGALPIDDDLVGDPVWTDPGIDSGGELPVDDGPFHVRADAASAAAAPAASAAHKASGHDRCLDAFGRVRQSGCK